MSHPEALSGDAESIKDPTLIHHHRIVVSSSSNFASNVQGDGLEVLSEFAASTGWRSRKAYNPQY